MPVLRHAKKKLRQDKKRTIDNAKTKYVFKRLVKKAKQEKTPDSVSKAFSSLDKAVKKNIIHKNKAARMKSALSKVVSGGTVVTAAKKATPKKPKAKPKASIKTSVKNAKKK